MLFIVLNYRSRLINALAFSVMYGNIRCNNAHLKKKVSACCFERACYRLFSVWVKNKSDSIALKLHCTAPRAFFLLSFKKQTKAIWERKCQTVLCCPCIKLTSTCLSVRQSPFMVLHFYMHTRNSSSFCICFCFLPPPLLFHSRSPSE